MTQLQNASSIERKNHVEQNRVIMKQHALGVRENLEGRLIATLLGEQVAAVAMARALERVAVEVRASDSMSKAHQDTVVRQGISEVKFRTKELVMSIFNAQKTLHVEKLLEVDKSEELSMYIRGLEKVLHETRLRKEVAETSFRLKVSEVEAMTEVMNHSNHEMKRVVASTKELGRLREEAELESSNRTRELRKTEETAAMLRCKLRRRDELVMRLELERVVCSLRKIGAVMGAINVDEQRRVFASFLYNINVERENFKAQKRQARNGALLARLQGSGILKMNSEMMKQIKIRLTRHLTTWRDQERAAKMQERALREVCALERETQGLEKIMTLEKTLGSLKQTNHFLEREKDESEQLLLRVKCEVKRLKDALSIEREGKEALRAEKERAVTRLTRVIEDAQHAMSKFEQETAKKEKDTAEETSRALNELKCQIQEEQRAREVLKERKEQLAKEAWIAANEAQKRAAETLMEVEAESREEEGSLGFDTSILASRIEDDTLQTAQASFCGDTNREETNGDTIADSWKPISLEGFDKPPGDDAPHVSSSLELSTVAMYATYVLVCYVASSYVA